MAKGKTMMDIEQATIERRRVRDPMMTDAEYQHQRKRRPDDVTAGTIEVDVNMVTKIGGLARVAGLTEAHVLAAAKFRDLFDLKTLGGARATDYSALRVDTSGSSNADALERGDQARRRYLEAVQELGMLRSSLVEKVVCHDMSIRKVAKELLGNGGGAAHAKVRQQLLEAIDVLIDVFDLKGGRGAERARLRMEGDRPGSFDGALAKRGR